MIRIRASKGDNNKKIIKKSEGSQKKGKNRNTNNKKTQKKLMKIMDDEFGLTTIAIRRERDTDEE